MDTMELFFATDRPVAEKHLQCQALVLFKP